MSDVAIHVENLSKQYRIGGPQASYKTIRESLIEAVQAPLRRMGRLLRGQAYGAAEMDETIWALKDVSFEVPRGEVVGIIGRNGAGKTTLLRILSRITKPTEGYAEVHGRVGSLLEVGTGFHPELTGRENIYLNGAILGMKRAEIERKFDEIVAFSGLEKFIDTPVKHFSSGMQVRLAFSVAAHLEPEILLVDEVLAVGDVEFQKKCLGKMRSVTGEGRTVLFVSHNMAAIQVLCHRVLQLTDGTIKHSGTPQDVIAQYLSDLHRRAHVDLRERCDRDGSGQIRITEIRFEDGNGGVIDRALSGQELCIILTYNTTVKTNHVSFEISFYNYLGIPILRCDTRLLGMELNDLAEQGDIVCYIPRLTLPAGTYHLNVAVNKAEGDYADHVEGAASLHVLEGDFFGHGRVQSAKGTVALLEHTWALENASHFSGENEANVGPISTINHDSNQDSDR